MKTLKHLALAALALAGMLLPLATSRPQPTLAGGTPLSACRISNVDVSASANGNQNTYKFDMSCYFLVPDGSEPFGPPIHVYGVYDATTGRADEELSTSSTKTRGLWFCNQDPWISPVLPTCSIGTVSSSTNDPYLNALVGHTETAPYSAEWSDPQVLFFAQLQYTANQAPLLAAQQAAQEAAAKEAAKQAAFLATKVTPVTPTGAILTVQEEVRRAAFLATEVTPITTTTNCAACSAVVAVAGWPQLSTSSAKSEAVTSLQYLLQKSAPALSVDGKFGPATDAAVRAFQTAQVPPLTADGAGIVGQQTWLALIVSVQQGSQGAAVRAVQSQLKSRNVTITVDGDFGSQTDAAVRAYQQVHSPPADGQVGPQTWKSLLAGS